MSNAAIYLRLSRDDGTHDESDSITNQRMILYQFAKQADIRITAEFLDDGLSGTKWERPGFQAMLQAAEDGWIDTVIVKDLSRLSRDYIRTGELLERWFPMHGIRLISVADQIDTHKTSADIYSSLRAVIDDWYTKDISRKVRAAIYARQASGICTSSRLPYGYIKQERAIQVHTERAETVKKVFLDYVTGSSFSAIARQFNERGIPAPRGAYFRWNDNSIRRILKNTAYIGVLHLHTTERISYKCDKKRILPEHDHVLIQIPPIIEESLFYKVAERIAMKRRRKSAGHWLSGRAFCDECGYLMTVQRENASFRLICGGRKRKQGCRNPSVLAEQLVICIQNELRRYGISADVRLLQRMIQSVRIGRDTMRVRLFCCRPTESELTEFRALLENRCIPADNT